MFVILGFLPLGIDSEAFFAQVLIPVLLLFMYIVLSACKLPSFDSHIIIYSEVVCLIKFGFLDNLFDKNTENTVE